MPTEPAESILVPVRNLSGVFKAYDVRGLVPDELDEDTARAVGAAFVRMSGARRLVTGRDMRPSSPALAAALGEGALGEGADVVDIGLASTDQLYYASGALDCAGAMVTASHNPARYNGIKLCRPGAAPVGSDSGLRELQRLVEQGLDPAPGTRGHLSRRDVLPDYAAHLLSLVDLTACRPLTVVVDAGNGMAGHTVPAVFVPLAEVAPVELVPLYFELDGTFPHHEANPLVPANLRDLQAKVLEVGADLGLAFDGDADRCFVVDERGAIVSPSALTALIAARELAREPGATVISNLITSRAVPEIVREHGGRSVRARVGHSYIKECMAQTGAVFAGEHSGHFYFRDFWRADSGMLAALHVLAALGATPHGTGLSALIEAYDRYVASGEVNRAVADPAAAIEAVRVAFAGRAGARTECLDGMTVEAGEWWFNLRPVNTEAVGRLDAEAVDRPTMERVRDEVLALVDGLADPATAGSAA